MATRCPSRSRIARRGRRSTRARAALRHAGRDEHPRLQQHRDHRERRQSVDRAARVRDHGRGIRGRCDCHGSGDAHLEPADDEYRRLRAYGSDRLQDLLGHDPGQLSELRHGQQPRDLELRRYQSRREHVLLRGDVAERVGRGKRLLHACFCQFSRSAPGANDLERAVDPRERRPRPTRHSVTPIPGDATSPVSATRNGCATLPKPTPAAAATASTTLCAAASVQLSRPTSPDFELDLELD